MDAISRSLFLASLLLGGCAPPRQGPEVARVVIGGAGEAGRFVALTDGQDVRLEPGAQGGFHVWVTFRMSHRAGGSMDLERRAHRLDDDKLVLRTRARIDLAEAGADGWSESAAPLPMFMCPSPIGLSVIDRPIVFELQFLDERGESQAAGAVTLTPRCPDDEASHAFCQRICTG